MNQQLQITLIATAVSAVLGSTAAAAALPTQAGLANFDQNAANALKNVQNPAAYNVVKTSPKARAMQQKALSKAQLSARQVNKNSLNGQGFTPVVKSDHFDSALNTHTFSWAQAKHQNKVYPFSVLSRSSAVAQASKHYVSQLGAKHGVSAAAFEQAELKYVSDSSNGAIISKYQQKENGIEVYGRQLNVLMNQQLSLVATSGYFANMKAPQRTLVGQFKLSAEQAVSKAFANIGGGAVKLEKSKDKANYERFTASSKSHTFSEMPRGKKVYYPGAKRLIPAYYVEIMASPKGSTSLIAYSHIISAVDGSVLNRTNQVQSDSFNYTVFADSTAPYTPFDSPYGNDLTPHPTGVYDDNITETQVAMNNVSLTHSGISTNDPWLPEGATTTTGNNVDAYADLVEPDGFNEGDMRPKVTSENTFDYPYDASDKATTEANRQSAIVNLFYVNNYLHDTYYDHGFDEAAGVAQMDNYGRGGIEGDPIHAEAQDYTGLNNATMATPADGVSPRMHMFLWQTDTIRDGTVDNPIIEHEWGHYISHRLTGGGMYVNNQGGSMGEGWGDFFALMTMARATDQLLPGNDQFQATYNDGGYAVNNGYVEYPYFFGLRRVPYTTNMEHNALTFKHIMDGVAIPTSHPINGLYTSRDEMAGLYNSEVHNAGEIWALMLWEVYVALLNRDGVSFNDSQGRMMDYMVASMKVTPFAPTYTEARDALLAVALATDEQDYNVIRTAFAKRGMGVTAVSPDRFAPGFGSGDGHAGVVESFEVNGSAVAVQGVALDLQNNSQTGAFCDVDGVLDAGETGLISLSIENMGTLALSGIKAQVTTKADITFANEGVIDFADLANWRDSTTATIEATLNSARMNDEVNLVINFMSDDRDVVLPPAVEMTLAVNYDLEANRAAEDFEDPITTWVDWTRTMQIDNGGSDTQHFISQWEVYDDFDFGNIAFGPNLSSENDISMISPEIVVADEGDFAINFEHYYDFEFGDPNTPGDETAWDGGVVEISVDGGEWSDVTAAGGSFLVGYNGTISDTNPALSAREGYVSVIPAFWIEAETVTFAQGTLNGKAIRFRFRIGSDQSVAAWGWNIDNITLTNAKTATPFSSLIEDSGICVNRAPFITGVAGPETALETTNVTLTGSGFDHDSGDLAYNWTQTAGTPATSLESAGSTLTFNAPRVAVDEVITFSAVAFDGASSSTESKEISVTVIANASPAISAEQATATANERGSVTLAVSGTDPENDSLTYVWMLNEETLATTTEPSYDFTPPSVSQDEVMIISVLAFDGIDYSEPTEIAVSVVANQAPVVTPTAAAVTMNEGDTVNLSVSGTDFENEAFDYQWKMDGVVQPNSSDSLSFTAPAVDDETNVVFSVTAWDGDATSEAVEIVVSVFALQVPDVVLPPPVVDTNTNSRSSGSGGLGLFALLLAPLAFMRRRKQR
ncbi:MAG: hypothetical protein ACI8WB_002517 [Phenylobacterium sp.]|jgi:hypothetical protein